jgi:hypothetical protein
MKRSVQVLSAEHLIIISLWNYKVLWRPSSQSSYQLSVTPTVNLGVASEEIIKLDTRLTVQFNKV